MLKLETKELLANALVELCKTKSLEKITVQNIVDFYGAGRQTFYNHFKDKEDLIEYIYLSDRRKGMAHLQKTYSLKIHIKEMLDIAAKKRPFYIYAYNMSGQNSLSEVVLKEAVDYYTNLILQKGGKEAIDDDMKMAIIFNCYGDLGCAKAWIKKEICCSSERVAEIMMDNKPEMLKKYLDE